MDVARQTQRVLGLINNSAWMLCAGVIWYC